MITRSTKLTKKQIGELKDIFALAEELLDAYDAGIAVKFLIIGDVRIPTASNDIEEPTLKVTILENEAAARVTRVFKEVTDG